MSEAVEALTPDPSSGGRGESAFSAGFSIVVAMDRKRGIGRDGGLPWPKLKGDMRFFRELTTCPDSAAVEKRWGLKPEESGEEKSWDDVSAMLKFAHKLPEMIDGKRNAVIMGRKTYESIPESYRPLPNRENLILSRTGFLVETSDGPRYASSWNGVWKTAQVQSAPEAFVIGGGQVFDEAQKSPACAHLYITEIDAEFPCDTYFPETPGFQPVLSSPWIIEEGIRYRFRRYDRVS